jgi:hypothetical protein
MATYSQISDVLTKWLLVWGAEGDVNLANQIWTEYRNDKIDEFEAVKKSPTQFKKLRATPQLALVDLITAFQEIGIPVYRQFGERHEGGDGGKAKESSHR